jgi:hypothetical protein
MTIESSVTLYISNFKKLEKKIFESFLQELKDGSNGKAPASKHKTLSSGPRIAFKKGNINVFTMKSDNCLRRQIF